jgi:hypothetical protein
MTIRRRNNAPIRPRRSAPVAADFAFAFAGGTFVMAGVFAAVSFAGPGFAAGDAGADLARLFAASLAVASVCALLIGTLLVGGTADAPAHVVVPVALGAAIGGLESMLIIEARAALLPIPFALLLFVPLPVRRLLRSGPRR